MSQWYDTKARYARLNENGTERRVTESYLIEAVSCTEAEALTIELLSPYVSGELDVTATRKTNIAEVFHTCSGDYAFKVKVAFITIDEKTAAEKRTAVYIVVKGDNIENAYANFRKAMAGTMADYDVEAVALAPYKDVRPLDAKL